MFLALRFYDLKYFELFNTLTILLLTVNTNHFNPLSAGCRVHSTSKYVPALRKRKWVKLNSGTAKPEGEALAGIKSLSLWTLLWHLKG